MDLARNIKIDSVSRLRPTPAWNLGPERTVADAIALMRMRNVGCILICADGRIVGIFTERDLLRRVLASGLPLTTPLVDCMTPQPVIVDPKDSISVAIRRMIDGGYRHLPVVHEGVPLGILSVKRIVHYLVEHFPSTIRNLPPDMLGKPCF